MGSLVYLANNQQPERNNLAPTKSEMNGAAVPR
jgi:hypothetical protein